jgi:hypothetical protein
MATGSSGWCCSARGRGAMPEKKSDYDFAVFLWDFADHLKQEWA